MNSKTWTRIIALPLFAALALSASLAAQDTAKKTQPHQYHHYQVADPGTFGGPQTFMTLGTLGAVGVLNDQGAFGGTADTSAIDPICMNHPPDCYASHGFVFQNGAKTDLGILPDGINSQVNWISANGLTAGVADNTHTDPLLGTPFQLRGTFWGHDGVIADIGSLPGTYFAFPIAVNNRGEVVGQGLNTIPDAYSMYGQGFQARAFLWDSQHGIQDLGTLPGGTDAQAGLINERGQVVGWSYTSSNPNLDNLCFGNALTTGSFIWDPRNGMRDIGNLGGSSCTLAHDLNSRGQIVGGSDIPLELQHPFVWDSATGMTDLGTPDGGYGVANALNEQGDVVGLGEANGGPLHAILWRKTGGKWKMIDLGAMGSDCGFAESINASRQVIGIAGSSAGDGNCDAAFLSDDGSPMVNLNALIPPTSGLQINEAGQINDRGEITVNATDANNNNHAVVLIPCDQNHPDVEGCDYSMVDANSAASVSPAPTQRPAALTPTGRAPGGKLNRFRFPLGQRNPGSGSPPAQTQKQEPPANKVTHGWLDDHALDPQYGGNSGYCEVNSGVLNGYCAAFVQSYGYCVAQPSSDCTRGQKPKTPGNYDCMGFHEYSADLGTKCSFVTVSPDFSLSASAFTPATVSPGASSTSAVDVIGVDGFSGSVALTCSVLPAPALAPACSISPNSTTPATPATLTVSTTPPTTGTLQSGRSTGLLFALWLPLMGLVATRSDLGSKQNSKGKITAVALACLLFAGVLFQVACGGGNSMGGGSPGTPAQTYTITVTGTDTPGTLVRSAITMLTVQ